MSLFEVELFKKKILTKAYLTLILLELHTN